MLVCRRGRWRLCVSKRVCELSCLWIISKVEYLQKWRTMQSWKRREFLWVLPVPSSILWTYMWTNGECAATRYVSQITYKIWNVQYTSIHWSSVGNCFITGTNKISIADILPVKRQCLWTLMITHISKRQDSNCCACHISNFAKQY